MKTAVSVMYYLASLLSILILSACYSPKKASKKSLSERLIASKQGFPFWKAENSEQSFYMLGTVHMGVSLSELPCESLIRDKIIQSPVVFVESFNPGLESIYNNFKDSMRKLYLGSKEEREHILRQVPKQTLQRLKATKLMNKASIMRDHMEIKFVEDEGQFKYLNKESQNFLIQHGLYDKNKSYLDYYFDIRFVTKYDAFFSQNKYLDVEIIKLALDHNIPVLPLDKNKKIVSELEQEIEELKNKKKAQELKFDKVFIDQLIANYEHSKKAALSFFSNLASDYKTKDWENETKASKGFLLRIVNKWLFGNTIVTRNELWLKKMLSNPEKQAVFMAGGYMHFVGSDSVLYLLEKEGLKVTLIDPETCQF